MNNSKNVVRPSSGLLGGALVATALLASAAVVVQARSRRAARDYPPSGRFVEVDGVRLHYTDVGKGPPVVLIHGNGAMTEDWRISRVVKLAAAHHRVIAFDRPGFGYSDRPRLKIWTPTAQAELLHQAMRSLDIERPVVVGHSWGTLVALAMALDHPDSIRGLVLISGYYFPTARADVVLLSPPAIPLIGDLMRYTVSPLLGRLFAQKTLRKVFAPAPVPPRFSAEFPIDLTLRPSQIRASAADTALMIPGAATLNKRYGELTMPVAIMAGLGDQIVEVEQAKRLHQSIAGSDLRLIDGAGHMVHHFAPELVAEVIDAIDGPSNGRTSTRLQAADRS